MLGSSTLKRVELDSIENIELGEISNLKILENFELLKMKFVLKSYKRSSSFVFAILEATSFSEIFNFEGS